MDEKLMDKELIGLLERYIKEEMVFEDFRAPEECEKKTKLLGFNPHTIFENNYNKRKNKDKNQSKFQPSNLETRSLRNTMNDDLLRKTLGRRLTTQNLNFSPHKTNPADLVSQNPSKIYQELDSVTEQSRQTLAAEDKNGFVDIYLSFSDEQVLKFHQYLKRIHDSDKYDKKNDMNQPENQVLELDQNKVHSEAEDYLVVNEEVQDEQEVKLSK